MATILLVDDDPLIRSTVKNFLTAEGHHITEAADGGEADRALASATPDLIITDILMPVREGIELILDIRKTGARVKILAISGGGRSGRLEFLDAAKKFGADAILAKPFGRKELLEAVRDLLA